MSRHQLDEDELDSHLPLLGGDCGGGGREEGRGVAPSPAMSMLSSQSHDVKHALDFPPSTDRQADTGADYSHIHIRPKPRPSDGSFLVRPPPPAYNHHRPDNPPPSHFHHPHPHPHPHRFQGGLVSGNLQRFRSPPQTLSLEDVSGYELSRRKSWSPPLLRQKLAGAGYQGPQKTVRSCHSSATVDWDTIPPGQGAVNPAAYLQGHPHHAYWQGHPQGHPQVRHSQGPLQGYLEGHGGRGDAAESLPPRLAPVSGVPPEKLSRNLIRPIAFKPAYPRAPVKGCAQCGEDASCCVCGGGQPASLTLAHGASLTSAHGASLTSAHGTSFTSARGASLTSAHGASLTSANGASLTSVHCPSLTSAHGASLTSVHGASQYKGHGVAQPAPCQPIAADPSCLRSPSLRSVDQSSVHSAGHSSYRSAGYGTGSDPVFLADDSPGVNVDYSPPRKASASAGSEVGGQTPSPSDSGVGELEAMLKEREAEILTLRQVMDRNERAIFQVYEEKRSQWMQDIQRVREDYERRLKATQVKATELEQALHCHSAQPSAASHTQQETACTPREDCDQKPPPQPDKGRSGNYANLEKEGADGGGNSGSHDDDDGQHSDAAEATAAAQSSSPPHHHHHPSPGSPGVVVSGVQPGVDGGGGLSVQEEMALKTTEVLALRGQLEGQRGQLQGLRGQLEERDQRLSLAAAALDAKTQELSRLHHQLDQLSAVDGGAAVCKEGGQTAVASGIGQEGSGGGAPPAPSLVSGEYALSLERQMDDLRQEVQAREAVVEGERLQWLEEKNKVIRYQKQLQLNYLQMQQKNRALEAEVEQLTMELESRHLKLAAMNGEESVC